MKTYYIITLDPSLLEAIQEAPASRRASRLLELGERVLEATTTWELFKNYVDAVNCEEINTEHLHFIVNEDDSTGRTNIMNEYGDL